MEPEQLVLLLMAALAAGWVDAVVGGGGLIQLPALMVFNPGQPVAAALATNKLASIAGTSSAAYAYLRRTKPDLDVAGPAGAIAVASAAGGAACAAVISSDVLRPVIMVVLLGVAALVVLRPDLGRVPRPVLRTRRRTAAAVLVPGVLIAFYDGLVGPGTGTFLVMAFTGLLGADFVRASANSKIINTGTNLGALIVFALQGHVLWALGLAMAVCNIAGAQLGAHMAIKRGAGFVRAVLLCVVTALVLKLAHDQFA
ncbi:sulfite exporter TauE/SafE family protein [Thermomonospora cellulosilytica]|uniref:Probable membrane transporter protein n=1 Tax=Thermomonospora cellulosilytica TaxID=1411118 RepID=A0A7W3MSN8_9ACTN|nr:TSUP family transporter [Thermomonospora cellulosilytica]MBA9001195.1 putative membrane protein YfcA [Thermomonospora cellulosilytica]